MLPPVSSEDFDKGNIRDFANICHQQMKDKLQALDEEVKALNLESGVRA